MAEQGSGTAVGTSACAATFVDTPIWVYAHLQAPGDPRHTQASPLLTSGRLWVISPQVVAAYYNVMLHNKRPDAWIQSNLRAMFARTLLQPANAAVLATALHLRTRYGFSFWDCQIAAAATDQQQHCEGFDQQRAHR